MCEFALLSFLGKFANSPAQVDNFFRYWIFSATPAYQFSNRTQEYAEALLATYLESVDPSHAVCIVDQTVKDYRTCIFAENPPMQLMLGPKSTARPMFPFPFSRFLTEGPSVHVEAMRAFKNPALPSRVKCHWKFAADGQEHACQMIISVDPKSYFMILEIFAV
jgi:hypothetical protein